MKRSLTVVVLVLLVGSTVFSVGAIAAPNGTQTSTPTNNKTTTKTPTEQSNTTVSMPSKNEVLSITELSVQAATQRQVEQVKLYYKENRGQLSDLEQAKVEQWLTRAGVDTSSLETSTPTPTPSQPSQPAQNQSFDVGSLVTVNDGGNTANTVIIDLKAYGRIYKIDYNPNEGSAWVYVHAKQPATLTFSDGNDRNDGGVSRVFISTQTVPTGNYRYKVQTDVVNGRQCIIVNGDGTPADYGLRHCNKDAFNLLTGDVPKIWIPYSLGSFLLGTVAYVGFWLSRRDDHGEPESMIDEETVPESKFGVEDYLDEVADEGADARDSNE